MGLREGFVCTSLAVVCCLVFAVLELNSGLAHSLELCLWSMLQIHTRMYVKREDVAWGQGRAESL